MPSQDDGPADAWDPLSPPTVDIIIPTNRVNQFLPETLASVRAQTWPHWRVTVVDDGGPDPQALDALAAIAPRTRVLHQRPAGTSAARNRGIRNTDGPLLVFLDDDDVWSPLRLERQVMAWLQAQTHVGVFCGGSYIDEAGKQFGAPWPAIQTQSRTFLSGEVPMPRIVTMMVRRDVCTAVGGFNEDILTGQEDLDFTLRVLQRGEMLAVPESLVLYRRHDHNISQAGSLKGRRAIDEMLMRQIGEARRRGDVSAVLLLREYHRRSRVAAARDSVSAAAAALRRHDATALLAEVRWATRAPLSSSRAAFAKMRASEKALSEADR